MLKSIDYLPKKIAWNGICLKTPLTWEIDSLDATHMLIGEDGSAKIEVKWIDSPKQFTLEKYLKKFISQSQRILNIKIHEAPAPGSFSHPLQCFEFFFFSWESKSSKGSGTLIFCSLCKRLTMIRFFSGLKFSPSSIPALILASFTDHPVTDQMQWQLFGLNFSSPKSFKLEEYSFKPGSYAINLKDKKTKPNFFSWGPASFLLEKASLSEFATERLLELKGFAKAGICRHGSTLEWSYRQERFKNANILPFMNRFSLFTLFKICHDQQNNRILAILIQSQKRFERSIIKGSIIGDV